MTEIDETHFENEEYETYNSENDDLGLYDALEDNILEPERAKKPSRQGKGSRKLMVTAGVLGGIIIIGLVALVIYNGLIQPQQTTSQAQVAAEVRAQNTVTAMVATALSGTKTSLAEKESTAMSKESATVAVTLPAALPQPKEISTATVVTIAPTKKPSPTETETNYSAKALADDISAAHTATVAALLTLSANSEKISSALTVTGPVIKLEAITSTAKATVTSDALATSLPATGIIGNLGLPGLLGGVVVLLGVIILARRIRKR